MPKIKSFRALRPDPDKAEKMYIYHGDAGDKHRSKGNLLANPLSLLRVSHPEIALGENDRSRENFPEEELKKYARETLDGFIEDGSLVREEKEELYIYRLSMANHSQTGVVALVDVEDFLEGIVKRHELTRADKVHTQSKQIARMGGNMEPILLVYDSNMGEGISAIIKDWAYSHDSLFDFYDQGGVRHEIWNIDSDEVNESIKKDFEAIPSFYICDGHHRIAASAEYYIDKSEEALANANGDSQAPELPKYRFFSAAIFPSEEMWILDYNRAVSDLNGMDKEEFLWALKDEGFEVTPIGKEATYPSAIGEYTMYMDGNWYRLNYIEERDMDDPVSGLDVSLLQFHVLNDILGIKDPQHDNRIAFISGNKGLGALEALVDDGMAVAFAIMPARIQDIMRVSDAGLTMPPKSTYFEPKLASGLLIYEIK